MQIITKASDDMNPFNLIPVPYQLLAKGIGCLVLVLALWAAWHAFTGHYVDIGKAARQPEIDTLKAANTELASAYGILKGQLAAQNKAVNDLKAESDKRQASGAAALAVAVKNSVDLKNKADWLSNQLAKPDAKTKGCADALKEWRAQP